MKCEQKKVYDTEPPPLPGSIMKPYKCNICGKWHLTGGMQSVINKEKMRDNHKKWFGLGVLKNGGKTKKY